MIDAEYESNNSDTISHTSYTPKQKVKPTRRADVKATFNKTRKPRD